jgi:hypothetical protein
VIAVSERERRYWGPYPGEVPLSRTSRPAPPPAPEAGPQPEPVAQPEPVPEPTRPAGPDPASGPEILVRVAERGPSRVERRRDGNAMVPLLAQALSAQLAKLAADVEPLPDGWWFTPQR